MLLNKKDIESKILELEKEYFNSKKHYDELFLIYSEYCCIKFFRLAHGFNYVKNESDVKVDILNRKIFIYKNYNYDKDMATKTFKLKSEPIREGLIPLRIQIFKNHSNELLELDIDNKLDDSLIDSNIYAYIISNIEKTKNLKIKGDKIQYIKLLEDKIIEATRKCNNLKSELDKYKDVLNNLK